MTGLAYLSGHRVKITLYLCWLVALCSCVKETPLHQDEPSQPNIILIMADDLGMETLATYGGESYTTPNLDHLSETGMRFENCYSTPLCTPSRVQLMTGKYNFRNYFAFGMLGADQRTFGHALKEAGYRTCIAGKWQLYGNKRQQELAGGRIGTLPEAAGFDTYRLWQVKDRGWRYKSPTLETKSEGLITCQEEYGPDKFVEFIESFMSDNRHHPFFVYYPMCLVHDPFLPSPDSPDYEGYNPEANINDTTYFSNMMSYMDRQVGRIVAKVDELGIRDNTIIIFTGDNGTDRKVISTWKGQMIAGMKGYPVETGTHVPLIVNWPAVITQPRRNDNLVDFTDFYPTLLDLAGTQASASDTLDGVSFYPQLLGNDSEPRNWVFCHYAPRWGNFPSSTYVHNKELKLYSNGDIFHIVSDPLEQDRLSMEQLTAEQQQQLVGFRQVLDQMLGTRPIQLQTQ